MPAQGVADRGLEGAEFAGQGPGVLTPLGVLALEPIASSSRGCLERAIGGAEDGVAVGRDRGWLLVSWGCAKARRAPHRLYEWDLPRPTETPERPCRMSKRTAVPTQRIGAGDTPTVHSSPTGSRSCQVMGLLAGESLSPNDCPARS